MNYQRPLGFATIGCGQIGNRRASTIPKGALKVACDLDTAKASTLIREHGGQATANPSDVFSHPEVDVVLISAANVALAPLTRAAVESGKHVLVEKPGAIRSRELKEIAKIAERTGARVRIGYNHRFHPAFLKTAEIVAQEDVGEFMFLRARYGHGGRLGYDREWRADPKLSGGGELIDQGVHLIDLASIWLDEFEIVEGHAATFFWDMKVDDNAFVYLRNSRGNVAWLHASSTEWKNLFSFELYFRRAKLHTEGLGGSYGVERLYHYKMVQEMGPPETTIYEFPRGDESWTLEMQEFLRDISIGREPMPGLREGIRTLEVVEKVYEQNGFVF
jgi:predicted dehydrogenase